MNEHDHESNNFGYEINHDFIDLINLDLIDFDLIDFDLIYFDLINFDLIDFDLIDFIVKIDFQSISIDSYRKISLSSEIVRKRKNHVFVSHY